MAGPDPGVWTFHRESQWKVQTLESQNAFRVVKDYHTF